MPTGNKLPDTKPTNPHECLTAELMKAASRKLSERLDELDALRPESIKLPADEEPFKAWAERYNLTIDEFYGRGSAQCDQFCIAHLCDPAKIHASTGRPYDARTTQEAYTAGIAFVRRRIVALQDDYAERLEAIAAGFIKMKT